MLRTSTRECSQQELESYCAVVRAILPTIPALIGVAILVGAVLSVCTFGVLWVKAWLTSGVATWTVPIIVGAVVIALTFVVLVLLLKSPGWRACAPTLATDVVASADAAWMIDDDSPNYRYILRCESDSFLIVNQNVWLPDFSGVAGSDKIGSDITLVLLGEGEFRQVIRSAVSGPTLPIQEVEVFGWADDEADPDTYRETPDGIYSLTQLPASLRSVVSASVDTARRQV